MVSDLLSVRFKREQGIVKGAVSHSFSVTVNSQKLYLFHWNH